MSYSIGKNLIVSIFGQSHSQFVGVSIDGLPCGYTVDKDKIKSDLSRRATGKVGTSLRREADEINILSGVVGGKTCGAPLVITLENTDCHSQDYSEYASVARPSHTDYVASVKYSGYNDYRGGGQFSARLTAPLVIAGSVVRDILAVRGVQIFSHIASVGAVTDDSFLSYAGNDLATKCTVEVPLLNENIRAKIMAEVESARQAGDSVGGSIECMVLGIPVGVGEPIFDSLESVISHAVFSIPAVKAIEFGLGKKISELRGSEANDCLAYEGKKLTTKSNNNGGILGGISCGFPLVFRAFFKPTPSIALTQDSVNFEDEYNVKLSVKGRHDPCVALRAPVIVESATSLAIYDSILENEKWKKI